MLQNIPHQIVQSPARLGLPNPNSPSIQNSTSSKFSSQNPQTQSAHPSSSQLTTPAVSSTLLPLLPPLPRAQNLLLQMASLASKLFEVSPNRSHWIAAFRSSLPTFLSSQMQSLALPPRESPPSSTKEILAQFTTLQEQLCEAVTELLEILDLQDVKKKLTREIQSKDTSLLAFANKLKEAESVLDILVDDYSDYRRPKRIKLPGDAEESSTTTVSTQLNLSDILSYAHKISYTTFAPPEFGAGQAPLRGALPPAPQDEQMRASQLYNFANLDIGLPKTDDDKHKIIEPLIEPPAAQPAAESNQLANIPGMQGLLPNFVVPPGWEIGMPVDVPIPPPGWKIGDPINLLPLDSEEQKAKAVAEPPSRTGMEPIQVRHVQLDIEDDSSDYNSSDDGSSDSED